MAIKPPIKPEKELKSKEIERELPQSKFKNIDLYRIRREIIFESENK
jgi:hypothetical protein